MTQEQRDKLKQLADDYADATAVLAYTESGNSAAKNRVSVLAAAARHALHTYIESTP